ncbi:MAG: response regulator [Candidatus Omnitrophota bacterium]
MNKEKKILLVDDEQDFRQLMTFWLESKGYAVMTASDGAEAVELVKKKEIDIVFMDVRMPGMDGVDAIKKIREFNEYIPIIVISAHVDDPKAKEAVAYGISGIFCKHKDFQEGLSLLESALRTHKKLKK